MAYTIKPIEPNDRDWVLEVIRGWGADFIVSRGRKIYAADLPGFIARSVEGAPVGLVTYEIVGDQCEIVTLDAFEKFQGIGTDLTAHVKKAALAAGCRRLWLITTNDNLDAIRHYQRRGFTIAAVHVNALAHSRELKPSISEIGSYNIPLRDEIEFEMPL
ncbi:MAG: GNAT family N-acetyltransferase [bacterium]|nr:GNAT family N-acetyltransferase [bacterium]